MKLRRGTALMLAVLCLLLCACGGGGGKPERVTLWCLEDDPLRQPLEELIQEYNRSPGDWQQLSLRCFPDEKSLAAAFDTLRPDLLLCSHDRAWTLEQQALLRDLRAELGAAAPEYPENLSLTPDGVGRGYFPLGVQVTLLCLREDVDGNWGALEALLADAADYGREEGNAFFTADSFGELFYQALLTQKTEFHADLLRDRDSPAYLALYNALAGGAFDRGITLSAHGAAELVAAGALPCGAGASSAMTVLPGEGFVIRPLPGLEEDTPLPGRAVGLAVTAREGRSLRSAAAFLRWLFSDGRAGRAALDAGLIPAALSEAPEAESPLEELLLSLGAEHPLFLLPPEGDYGKNQAAFEQAFRAVLRRFL